MVEERTFGETSAPFNMAIDTLQRLGDILREIKQVSFIQTGEAQRVKVSLVRQFFFNAVPLLKEEVVTNHKPIILGLMAKECKVINRYTNQFVKNQPIWDAELEKNLDNILINIQQELQKEKYFMPPKKDLGKAVSEF